MASIGCILLTNHSTRQVHQHKCITEKKIHPPYEWALPGTLENLAKVNEFLKEKSRSGYLFGGCLNKRLPRKDIDVFSEYDLEGPNCGYKTLGVDWWIREYSAGYDMGKNVNGIIAELGRSDKDYHFKDGGGLLLPKNYLLSYPKSNLTKLLYSKSELQELKGGEKK